MENSECRLYLGPMFSGKTDELLRQVKRARVVGIHCVVVKYAKDTRYGTGPTIFTHDGTSLTGDKDLRIVEARTLDEVKLSSKEKVIAVDEGQFYPDLPHTVDKWMRQGRKVYISALDGDYLRKPFGKVGELIPLCTHVVKLHAVCMSCKEQSASYTLRIVESEEQKLIGAEDAYMSTCLKCYIAKTNPHNYIASTPIPIPLQKSNTKFSHTFPTNWR